MIIIHGFRDKFLDLTAWHFHRFHFKNLTKCANLSKSVQYGLIWGRIKFALSFVDQFIRRPIRPLDILAFAIHRMAYLDNLANFHEWQDWWKIAHSLPIAVIDRPGSTLAYRSARAALALSRYRVDEADASLLADMKPPAWTFLHGPRSPLSSTWLRAQAEKNGSAGKKAR